MNEIKGIVMLILMPLIAYLAGNFCCGKKIENSIGRKVAYGSMGLLCLYEILSVPLILLRMNFHILFWSYSVVVAAIGFASIIFYRDKILSDIRSLFQKKKNWWYIPAFLMIMIQIIVAVMGMHIDDDDAFYLGTTMTTLETDTMYQVSPYTGVMYFELPYRYILSPFPVFMAVLSKWFRIHPAILAHTVWPVLAITLSYLIYILLAKELFEKSTMNRGIFLFFTAVINTFGYYSVYSASTFLLIRSWQGKAVLAGCILPMLFYALFMTWKSDFGKKNILPVLLVEVAAAAVSSMGIFLAPLMTGIWGVSCWMQRRKRRTIFYSIIFVLPGLLLGVSYILLRSGGN